MNARLPQSALPGKTPHTIEKETTVFMSGNSQAVRIPKEFQLKTKQVRIIQRGGDLVIKPKYRTGAELLANLPPLSSEDQNDGFDLAAIVRESNRQLPPERDLSHLFAKPAPKTNRKPRAKTAKASA
jgi:antitoxin VapB